MSYIKFTLEDGVGTIVFDNFQKCNALNCNMISELILAFDELIYTNARVIVLRTANDTKIWSSGFDINELTPEGNDPLAIDQPLAKLLNKIKFSKAPVIAMISGSVFGGACSVVVNSDLVVGDSTASFAVTSAKIGFPYSLLGVSQFVERIGVGATKRMFFTGESLCAKRAFEVGLLDYLVDKNELITFTYKLANSIADNAPLCVAFVKEQIGLLSKLVLVSHELTDEVNQKRLNILKSIDYAEGLAAFRGKRKPNFVSE